MGENENFERSEPDGIYSKVLRAGRRTYFFDVRETRAGDYYLTITESKKNTNEDGSFFYKKHKIYLYKEDFGNFKEILNEITSYVVDERGEEVISERHQKNFDGFTETPVSTNGEASKPSTESFTDVDFDDI
ncbi:PUR family DNA/RNA-binding protein [Moheibacter lacus]|uniref:PUR family DNA/RNA-binding protein n=1 Tax=Moheibacter lacus TaxID=2745851 RepID=A0A838ZP02_9FLAO|nr:PUR family DNA/RNA-binding protein [Moheibacter lacus]MBA5628475.1 PUR family DNA/RNA-binding protein [Moheibacter lacus]